MLIQKHNDLSESLMFNKIRNDLRKCNIKDTGRSREKYEDHPKAMYEEVDDSRRGERGMQRAFDAPVFLVTSLGIQRKAKKKYLNV